LRGEVKRMPLQDTILAGFNVTHSENAAKWLEQKAVEQKLGGLNDEIESLKGEKKKLRGILDDKVSTLFVQCIVRNWNLPKTTFKIILKLLLKILK
jgi:hypothetical protein